MRPGVKNASKRPRVLLPVLLVVLFALAAAPALASRGHVFKESFSGPCVKEPCGGLLKEPSGVAVNEATGDVYVVDKGEAGQHGRVARFEADGKYVSEFNGSGLLAGEGIEAGSGGQPGESGGTGTLPGERGVATGRFSEPEGIAVDNSCVRATDKAECEAQDPSNGDVYVVDAAESHSVIDKYSPEGKYLGQLTEAGGVKFQGRALDGVAVDPEGKVWIYREEGITIVGFSNAAANKFEEAIPLLGKGLSFPPRGPGLAVDSKGAFYVRAGSVPVAKVSNKGEVLIDGLGGEEAASAVAVDQTDDNSFIDNLTSIRVSAPDGTELERLGEEGGAKHLTQGAGIGVDAASESLYVADAGTGTVIVFGPTLPGPPTVERESDSIANVTGESADLSAAVNPRSEAGEAATEYHFEYGACATATTCSTSGFQEVPGSGGQLPPDFEPHVVGAHLQGLAPDTTYHFRAVARNSHDPVTFVDGEEATFTTQGPGGRLVLPDERGWELVSSPDKDGSLIGPISETGVVQAAAGGGGITYLANAPTEAQPQGYSNEVQVLSRRSASEWSSSDIAIPHSEATGVAVGGGQEYRFFDTELTAAVVHPFGQFDPQLSGEASESTAYLRDLGPSCGASCFKPLVTGKPGFSNVPPGTQFGGEGCTPSPGNLAGAICGPIFLGATTDLRHVVLFANAPLTPGAGAAQLYEWTAGALSQVSVLPDGESAEGAVTLGLESTAARGAISADGTRVVWERKAAALYLRDMSRQETVRLDEAEAGCGECESGEGRFQLASGDGSRVLFTDARKLTKDSGSSPAGGQRKSDLYECQITIEAGKLHCALRDLTPKRGGESAEVQGSVLGGSEDGSYLYLVAKGVLSEAPNSRGQSAVAGQPNLYLRHAGAASFIATLAGGDEHDWEVTLAHQPTRVSPNGQFLELMSEARLTGYDNRDVATGKPAAEVFLYDASRNQLSCASCQPSGARPVGVEYEKLEPSTGLVGGHALWTPDALVAANVPGWPQISVGESRYQPRYLSNSGRLFFNTVNGLVAQDSNGTQDVYEYEPLGITNSAGKELCTEAMETFSARSGGCVGLISSGSSGEESAFMDASENGDDVFFLTAAKLSPLDTDTARDIYDAHVCSDSPCITSSTVQSPPCTTEASCKAAPTPQPAIFGAPSSATFQGLGNPPPATAKVVVKSLTRAQKLAKALKACKKDRSKSKRAKCERSAHSKYGAKAKVKRKRAKR